MENTNFVFDETIGKRRIPESFINEELRRFAASAATGKWRQADFNAWPGRRCKARTIAKRFGSWRRALWSVGITSARRGRYSPDELIQILEQVWRKIERPPGHAALKRFGHISGQLYVHHWGSLKHARDKFARFQRAEISRAELLAPAPPSSRRAVLRPKKRLQILQRDNHRCQLCGRSPSTDPDTILEIDHIHPVAKGGTDTPKNLRTLCRQCNRGKAAA